MIYYYFKDHKGEWRWLLKAGNGRLIAASGEAYEEEQECLYDIELVKGSSSSLVRMEKRGPVRSEILVPANRQQIFE